MNIGVLSFSDTVNAFLHNTEKIIQFINFTRQSLAWPERTNNSFNNMESLRMNSS